MNARARINHLLLASLAAGDSPEDAAEMAGCSASTVYRRLNDEAFVAELDAAKKQVVSRALDLMAGNTVRAAEVLRVLLESRKEPIRLGAARACLEFHSRLRDTLDLQNRLDAIEDRDQERKRDEL